MTENITQAAGAFSHLAAELGRITTTITWARACDRSFCPICESENIWSEDSGCMCHCKPSCWSHPVCKNCGYTAGSSGGNSDGGIWVSFGKHSPDDAYEITHTVDDIADDA